jgi:hypothetical protein
MLKVLIMLTLEHTIYNLLPLHIIATSTKVRIYSDNLILEMAGACRCGVESGKLKYQGTFEHVLTSVYMSYRPNELFVPKQHRK